MTGFIRGLFGGGKRQPAQPKNTGAFFLSEDEAKTFGDIDYMRSNKVVRRTFARKKGQTEEMESIRTISAMKKQEVDERGVTQTSAPTASTPSAASAFERARSFEPKQPEQPKFERRQDSSSDMDMFRKMAKDIKRR